MKDILDCQRSAERPPRVQSRVIRQADAHARILKAGFRCLPHLPRRRKAGVFFASHTGYVLLASRWTLIYPMNALATDQACIGAGRARHGRCRGPVRQPDRRERRAAGADGQPRLRGCAFDQWRLGAALSAAEGDAVQGSAPYVPGADQQQDQWHHPAPVADAVQSGADRADRRDHRRPLPRRHRRAARSRALCEDRPYPPESLRPGAGTATRLCAWPQARLDLPQRLAAHPQFK